MGDDGQSQGTIATGFMLIDMADPKRTTGATESFGYKQLLFEPFVGGGLITALAVPLIHAFGPLAMLAVSTIATVAVLDSASGWLGHLVSSADDRVLPCSNKVRRRAMAAGMAPPKRRSRQGGVQSRRQGGQRRAEACRAAGSRSRAGRPGDSRRTRSRAPAGRRGRAAHPRTARRPPRRMRRRAGAGSTERRRRA